MRKTITNLNKNAYNSNKGGFTLIELILVIVIIAIISLVAIPVISGYVKSSGDRACESNRNQLARLYAVFKTDQPYGDFDTFLETVYNDDVNCPKGGTYSLNGSSVICSVHDGEDPGGSDPDDPPPPDPNLIYLPDEYVSPITGTWASVLEDAAEAGYGVSIPEATVYSDGTGDFYIMKNPSWVNPETPISEHSAAVKIITDRLLKPEDVIVYEVWSAWRDSFLLEPGFVRLHTDDKLYVYVGPAIQSTETDATLWPGIWKALPTD